MFKIGSRSLKVGLLAVLIVGACLSMISCYLVDFANGVKKESAQSNSTGIAYFSSVELKGSVNKIVYSQNGKIYAYDIVLTGSVGIPLKLNPTNLFVYSDESGSQILTIYQNFNPTPAVGQIVCKDKGSLYFHGC
jgi:hypothetical protein